MYFELEARSVKLDAGTGASSDPQKAALHAALAERGATLFHFLLLDGLPIAGTLSLRVGQRIVQLESAWDLSFEDAAPEEVLLMFALRDAICRGATGLELGPDLVDRREHLGATATPCAVVHVFRRFGPHHLQALWRAFLGEPRAIRPAAARPPRSDLGRQLRARTHAAEAFDRLDQLGAEVQRLWGDPLRAALPFNVDLPEHERVRRAV
jgi:hypothetical protein